MLPVSRRIAMPTAGQAGNVEHARALVVFVQCEALYALANRQTTEPQVRKFGGEVGIRTLDSLTTITVFETAAFDHSATSPLCAIPAF